MSFTASIGERLLGIPRRIRMLLGRGRFDRDIEEEMRLHREMKERELIEQGIAADEAHYAAERQFGNSTLLREISRDAWGWRWLEDSLQDVRFGARMLRKSPGFTAVAVLTLALGIGANAAIFGLVNSIVLLPLPFLHAEKLVRITDTYPPGALPAMRTEVRTMEVATYSEGSEFNLTGLGEPSRLYGASVSAEFFAVLGAQAEKGRVFQSGEDQPGKARAVVLSHALWQQKFGSDQNIIGRWMTLDGANQQIIGVLPADFHFPSNKAELWVPLNLDPRRIGPLWGGPFLPVIGRLRPGISLDQARAEVRLFGPRIRSMFPWRMPDDLFAGASVISLQDDLVGGVGSKLLILFGAIGIVLLIACANVANLLLARAATRQKEIALRAALGAGRWRICRQLLVESVLLALLGAALGFALAWSATSWLKAILPADTPRLATVALDWRVVAFTAGIAILTGLIFGLAPALYASRANLNQALKSGGQRSAASASNRMRSTLAVAEIALACILVIAAGLMVKSLWELSRVDPGFRPESIVTARITPNRSFCREFARCQSFYNALLDGARALPGVKDAALVNVLPLNGRVDGFAADLEGNPRPAGAAAPMIFESVITPDYLRVMGIRLLKGREFDISDSTPSAQAVAIVTESTARKFWPNQDPIGKHVKPVFLDNWITVVGVVGDVALDSLASKLPKWCDGAIYEPYGNAALLGNRHSRQQPTEMTLVVRASSDPRSLAGALRSLVSSVNPDVPVSEVQTLRAVVSDSLSAPRSTMSLFAAFAALALVLGAVGVYGVISYSVAQRTPEIGLRVALGAQPRSVLRLVMSQGARLVLAGLAIGLAGAIASTRLMASLLYGVSATDPLTFAAVAFLLAFVALAACYVPARRAMRVDPAVALRNE